MVAAASSVVAAVYLPISSGCVRISHGAAPWVVQFGALLVCVHALGVGIRRDAWSTIGVSLPALGLSVATAWLGVNAALRYWA